MSAAPETKYTDRDVRENDELVERAIEYVEGYAGDFQYLIDCKMRLAQGVGLTTGHVRGILNCMRVDPRVMNLPSPLPYEEGQVIEMPARKAKHGQNRGKTKMVKRIPCDIEGFHNSHGSWGPVERDSDDPYEHCLGIYEINRDSAGYPIPAIIHTDVPYMMSRTGKLIHRHNNDAWFMWRPNAHSWGWWKHSYSLGVGMADFYVRSDCKYPRIIDDPILMRREDLFQLRSNDYLDAWTGVPPSNQQRALCPRCFPNGVIDGS